MTIKAITFDFWATLYQPKTVNYNQRLYQLKEAIEAYSGETFDLAQFQAAVQTARTTWSRAWEEEHRTIAAGEWLGVMLTQLGISLAPPHLLEIKTRLENSVLDDLPAPVAGVETMLAGLARDYRLAVISDTGLTPGRILHQIMKKDRLDGYFAHFTFSDEVGYSKPNVRAFLATLKALAAKPHEAVHIGDLLRTDIDGAQKVGMRAVQYIGVNYDQADSSSKPAQTPIIPDAIIKDYAELPLLLKQWQGGSS
ncbi:MAG: HAD family hydrolase [Anaerolineae bacterium]|nr:HAD family hydrolase [Anaerolineae bacterium]